MVAKVEYYSCLEQHIIIREVNQKLEISVKITETWAAYSKIKTVFYQNIQLTTEKRTLQSMHPTYRTT